jgi:hypothetical protein
MSRVVITENAKVVREYVSPVTTIHWDPMSNTGILVYNVKELLFVNDVLVSTTDKTTASIPLETVVSSNYDVEVAAGQFVTVSGGLIMLAFKKAFEDAIAKNMIDVGQIPPPVVEEPAP